MEDNTMKNNAQQIQAIILFGALWGLSEASIGYMLHFLPYGFSGMFMFPIGFYFMYNAYKQTNKQNAVLWVGIIAATIKLVDLLLPTRSLLSVINPATSILLESLVVFAFVKMYNSKKVFVPSLALGLGWITLFALTQAFIFRPASGLYLYPLNEILIFVLLNAVVSGLLIALYLKKEDLAMWRFGLRKASYVLPLLALAIAIALELTNSLII